MEDDEATKAALANINLNELMTKFSIGQATLTILLKK